MTNPRRAIISIMAGICYPVLVYPIFKVLMWVDRNCGHPEFWCALIFSFFLIRFTYWILGCFHD